jgi:hypothetical protein
MYHFYSRRSKIPDDSFADQPILPESNHASYTRGEKEKAKGSELGMTFSSTKIKGARPSPRQYQPKTAWLSATNLGTRNFLFRPLS